MTRHEIKCVQVGTWLWWVPPIDARLLSQRQRMVAVTEVYRYGGCQVFDAPWHYVACWRDLSAVTAQELLLL